MQVSSATKYFFDYPIADVHTLACSALKLICHGSVQGAFGNYGSRYAGHRATDLGQIEAFRISLDHLTAYPMSEDYEYSLVYVTKELSRHLWEGEKRTLAPDLKRLTRRVHLNETPDLTAKRFKTPFWVKFTRPIYLAKYEEQIIRDHYVPEEYYKQFHSKYQGFLMRSENNYPLVRNLFEAYGLKMEDRREVRDLHGGNLQILSYSTRVEE